MLTIYNLIMTNTYLYVIILLGLIILTSILLILSSNESKRRKIKKDFIEAEKIEEELEKIEEAPVSNELEAILQKMQQDIDVKPEDVVRNFEQEQEEKAIISYQELVDNVKAGKIDVIDDEETNINFVEALALSNDEPLMQISEEESESKVTPTMVKDAINEIVTSSVKEETVVETEVVKPVVTEEKKFKKSEFISPIFGIMQDNSEYPTISKKETMLDIMNTRDYNKLTEEIKRQEEFLNALKEFRKNL